MSDACATETVRWILLGDVSVTIDNVERALAGQRQRAVLAALILRAGHSVSVDEIIESVWGDNPPKTARKSIQRFVADIRGTLGPFAERLVTTPQGYRLDAPPAEVDAEILREHLAAAHADIAAGQLDSAAEQCRAALALRRGTPLGGIGDVWFKHAEAAALDELIAAAAETGLQVDLDRGLHAQTVERLRRFADEHPVRESAWELLMIGLYRSGRQQEALDAAASIRSRLLDEHGMSPSSAMRDLEVKILNQDPTLDGPAPSSDATGTTRGLNIPVPSSLTRTMTGPIVGRTHEIERFAALLEAAAAGSMNVCFVHGEAGIGKTRLLAELTTIAQPLGVATIYGRATEDAGLPYASWSAALHHLLRSAPEVINDPALAAIRDDLESLVPELASPTRTPRTDPSPQSDAETRRAALFRSITYFLNVVSERQPLAIVLDDLQWAETSSLDLLRHVARHGTGSLLVVAAYRDTDVGADHRLAQTVGVLQTEPTVHTLPLAGLGRANTAALISNLVGSIDDHAATSLGASIEAATNGNPFFTTEIVKNLAEHDDQVVALVGSPEIPDTVRTVIDQRVGRLGDISTQALRAASVCGREFDLGVVASALAIPERELLDSLVGALDAALIAEHPRHLDRFTFSHDLMRQTLYDGLSSSLQRRLHADVAAAMLDRSGANLASRAAEIAQHLRLANSRELDDDLVCMARLAARHSAEMLAPDDAAEWLATALDHVDANDAAVAHVRAELMVELGCVQREAGLVEYRQTLLDAGRLAHDIGATDALTTAALMNTRGTQTHVWEVDTERVELLRLALEAIGPEPSIARADLLAGLGSEQWDDAHRAESADHRAEAIAIARQLGDVPCLVNALARAARPRNAALSNDAARLLVDELHPFADQIDLLDPHLAVNVLRTIQAQALRDADVTVVREMSAAIHRLADRLPLAICIRASKLTTVLEVGLAGDHEAYERHAVDALEHCIEMGDPEAGLVFEAHLFYARHLAGRIDEVAPIASQLYADNPDNAVYRSVAAIVATTSGDDRTARQILDSAANDIVRSHDVYEIQSTVFLAEVAAMTGHESMEHFYSALIEHRGQLAGQLQNLNWPMDLTLGSLATGLGRFDVAEEHFAVSLAVADRFDAPWMTAQTQLRLAALRRASGHSGGEELVARASATAREHGFAQLLVEAAALAT